MAASTLEQLLETTDSRKIFLCTLTLGIRIRNWTATSGYNNTFQSPFAPQQAGLTRSLVAVEENSTQYSEKNSIADVDSAASAYYWDSSNSTLYISPSGPDPTSADSYIVAWFQIRISNDSRDGAGSPLILDGNYYNPILTSVSPISAKSTDLFGSLGSAPATCSLDIANSNGTLDEIIYNWIWIGGDAEILFGGEELPLQQYATIFLGTIAKISSNDYSVTLSLESGENIFNRSVPPNSYSVAEYPDLAETDEGKPIPLVFGEVDNISPVRIAYRENYYLELDGSEQYAYRPNSDLVAISFTGSFTIEARVTFYSFSKSGGIAGIYGASGTRSYLLYYNEPNHDFRFVLSGDGSSTCVAEVNSTEPRAFHQYVIRAAYDSDTPQIKISIDGVDQNLTITGAIPTSLFNSTLNFQVGTFGGGGYKLHGRIHELILAEGYYPENQTMLQVVSHWNFDKNLLDSAGQNHLTGAGIQEDDYHLNYGLALDGSNYAYIRNADQSGLGITGPITISVRFKPAKLEGRQVIVAKWEESANQQSYMMDLDDQEIRLVLSSNGTDSFTIKTTSAVLQVGLWYEVKATYNTQTNNRKIYVNGTQHTTTTSGTAPSSIFNSTSQFRIGAKQDERNGIDALVDWVAVASSYQDDSGPIKNAASVWDFRKNLKDTASTNHLTGNSIDSSSYLILSSDSVYKIADHNFQTLQAVSSVRDGELEITGGDYQVDLEKCEIRLSIQVTEKLLVDVKGATMGDLLGNESTSLITRAAHIVNFFLSVVAGKPDSRIDEASIAIGSAAAPIPLNLFLDSKRDLGAVLKEVCDSVFADLKVIDGLFTFQVLDPHATAESINIYEEELANFNAISEPGNIWNKISVRYAHDGAGESSFLSENVPEAVHLYGRELAHREFTTRLVNTVDAEFFLFVAKTLARSRQFLIRTELLSPKLINSNIGDKVKITRSRGPGGPLAQASYEITEIDKNFETGACRLVLSNLSGLRDTIARFVSDSHPNWASSSPFQRDEGGYFTDDNGRADPDDPDSENKNLFWR